jgi:rhodanese-related sulfurtransferase
MSTLNTISIDKLIRLIGTPQCPILVDVQTDEDFAADPRLVAGAVRRPWEKAADWAPELDGRPAVVIRQKGLKLSQGVAAWLRHAGVAAEVLEGEALAWGATEREDLAAQHRA